MHDIHFSLSLAASIEQLKQIVMKEKKFANKTEMEFN